MILIGVVGLSSVLLAAPVPDELDLQGMKTAISDEFVPDPVPFEFEPFDKIPINSKIQHWNRWDFLTKATRAPTIAKTSSEVNLFPSSLGTASAAFSTVLNTRNVSNSTAQDFEPSIVAVNLNGQLRVTSAYIRATSNTNLRIRFSTYVGNNAPVTGLLPLPSGFVTSVDPYLAVNGLTNGVAPKRKYLVGLLFHASGATRIVVWRSGNGGVTWSQPVTVDNSNGLDKPHIVVSTHPATRGHVYVAYRTGTGQLAIRRSTNGGITFSTQSLITTNPSTINLNGVQLAVSPFTGFVYAFWSDYTADRIRWARSTNQGISWSGATNFSNARNLMTGYVSVLNNNCSQTNTHQSECLRAPSFPIIRFNWPSTAISVVWHECSQAPVPQSVNPFIRDCIGSGRHTDVYYARLSQFGASTKVRLNDVVARDQFSPALDFDTNGDLLVTFYDRRNDFANNRYRLYRTRINSFGQPLPSDPTDQLVNPVGTSPNIAWSIPGFIGDYHEVWSDVLNGQITWFSSWIRGRNAVQFPTDSDNFVATIQP